jgi:hypothetical protein
MRHSLRLWRILEPILFLRAAISLVTPDRLLARMAGVHEL